MMARTSTWYVESLRVIAAALEDARARGLDDAATLAHVDAQYPYGLREHWPYKQWLRARRKLCRRLLPARDPEGVDPQFWTRLVGGEPPAEEH
jgi:hypothetical protein